MIRLPSAHDLADIGATWSAKVLTALVRSLPFEAGRSGLLALTRLFAVVRPELRETAMENLALAFPERSEAELEEIYKGSLNSFAALVYDASRLPSLSPDWLREHVEFPRIDEFRRIEAESGGKGVLIATGHLGSFELFGAAAAAYGINLNLVVRDFPLERLNHWWKESRERNGNTVISRKGAYRRMLTALRNGSHVALLIDQNIRRQSAVFVPWFGKPAATTKALALAALKEEPAILVAGLVRSGPERYRILWNEVDTSDIYRQENREKKIYQLTEQASSIYVSMIRESPEEWFWFHRRWKTLPEGEPPMSYSK